MLSPLIAGIALLGIQTPDPTPFDSFGPYDRAVPAPEAVLGYRIGSRITTFRDQERVLNSIASSASARVKVIGYGKSVQDRPLKIVVVSSPENIAKLEQIRKEHNDLAEGQTQAKATVPIVWINETIHGNEPASFESGMQLVYNLAASQNRAITDLLKDVVVIVNPVYNPDGHERFAVYYNSVAVGASERGAYEMMEPGVVWGRANHYRFDMNRDRVSFSQDETRQEVAEFLRWHPQVYVDQHGQVDTYFFPPNPMAVNANVDRNRLNRWTDIFGRETAKAFDERGYSYYAKDAFDFYYPGYTDTNSALMGAIAMTHETDGGKQLAKLRDDGTVVTLRHGAEKHFTSAIAVIRASAKNRAELMSSYADYKKKAVTGEFAGNFKRVVMVDDRRNLARIADQLSRTGIKSRIAQSSWTQEDANDYWSGKKGKVTFPAGALVVDIAQSQGPMAKALLEPTSDFEPEFLKSQNNLKKTAPEDEEYPGPDGSEFYDITGWALPYAHNVKAWWCESAPNIAEAQIRAGSDSRISIVIKPGGPSTVGYALAYTDQDDVLAIHDMLAADIKVLSSPKEMQLGAITIPAGSFIILNERNEPGFEKVAAKIAEKRGSLLLPLPTQYPDGRWGPGSGNTIALRKPKIGIVFGRSGDLGSVGSIWYLMERVFKLPFTPLSSNALNGDLSKYSCIVAPSGTGGTATAKLKDWVNAGGSLVILEQPGWALGSSGFVTLDAIKGEPQSLPGSLFRAELDPRSFLSYGYGPATGGKIEIAVPIAGSTFYKTRKEGGSVVAISSDEKAKKLLTGWEFDDDTEKNLAGTVWLQLAPTGNGHVTIFTQDPTERAMWQGLYKLLLNSMIMGARNP